MNEDKKFIILIFIVLILTYVAVSMPFSSKMCLTGDEPHYLVMARSLLHDGDLDLDNNYRDNSYKSFFPYDITPHYSEKSRKGHCYPRHNIGLPIIMIPFYSVGEKLHMERHFCLLLMSILMSLAACNTYGICRKFIEDKKLCFLTVVLSYLSLPLIGYSLQIYPEVPFILLLTFTIKAFLDSDIGIFRALAIGICIGFMPWLHQKFLLVALPFLLLFTFKKDIFQNQASRNMLVSSAIVCFILLSFIFNRMYGTFNILIAQYDMPFQLKYLIQGLLGWFVDQQHGLFLYTPIYIFIIAGLVMLFREHKLPDRRKLVLIVLSMCYSIIYISSAANVEPEGTAGWHGGFSMFQRYSMILTPLFILSISFLISRNSISLKLMIPLFLYGIGVAFFFLTQYPRMLYDPFRDGSILLSALSTQDLDYRLFLPNLLNPVDPVDSRRNLILAFIMLISIIALNFTMISGKTMRKIWSVVAILSVTAYAVISFLGFIEVREHSREHSFSALLFESEGGRKNGYSIISDFSKTDCLLAYGPSGKKLLKGEYRADFLFRFDGLKLPDSNGSIFLGVGTDRGNIRYKMSSLNAKDIESYLNRGIVKIPVEFTHFYPLKYIDFNIFIKGKPYDGHIEFLGIEVCNSPVSR